MTFECSRGLRTFGRPVEQITMFEERLNVALGQVIKACREALDAEPAEHHGIPIQSLEFRPEGIFGCLY